MANQPPLYQLVVTPSGAWRARVFNLPPHREGQAPTLSFLRALAANPVGQACDWQKDPEEKFTVLRLAGNDRPGMEKLLQHLRAHGISRATAFAPVAKRPAAAASS